MPLLIVPLVVFGLLSMWVLLLPLSLWLRYRSGTARRRAVWWVANLNFWSLLLSLLLFLAGMVITNLWWSGAMAYASAGVGAGGLTGILGLRLCRFERTPQGLFYTPNRGLVLSLTLLVIVRLAMGLVEFWRRWQGRESLALIPAFDHASLFAVAGLLLGYYVVFTWGLRRRVLHLRP